MTHIILGHCCKDATCVSVCPQNCIHPTPDEAAYGSVETLHIDPRSCIDCTACVDACPASAIKSDRDLAPGEQRFAQLAVDFYEGTPAYHPPAAVTDYGTALGMPSRRRSVAIIGSGPAALYTLREILRRSSAVRVTVFEQHREVGGLLRRGVSLDQPEIRAMIDHFEVPLGDDRVTLVTGTEIGVDLSIAELRSSFDAVVLACGATEPRVIGDPAAPRSRRVHQALDLLVAHNQGSPAPTDFGRLGPRCVVVGGGNVALDAVRYLAGRNRTAPKGRAVSDITVLSRSPIDRPAFTASTFYELCDLPDVEVFRDSANTPAQDHPASGPVRDLLALDAIDIHDRGRTDGGLRVVLSFGWNVTGIDEIWPDSVVVTTDSGRNLEAESVVTAVGFTSKRIEGIPVGIRGTVPNRHGRIISPETGNPLEGLYVVGWAKRGPTGGIGDNRRCAAETVELLAADLSAMSDQRVRAVAP